MPWSISERSISRRPSVKAMATGGYEVADRPNPNSGMEVYKRGIQAKTGRTSGPLLPTVMGGPTPDMGSSGGQDKRLRTLEEQETAGVGVTGPDSLGIGVMRRGMDAKAAQRLEAMHQSPAMVYEEDAAIPNNSGSTVRTYFESPSTSNLQQSTRGNYLADPRFEGLKQSLYEAGVDSIATGAAKFGDAPGFFDTQRPSLNGLQSVGQMNRQNAAKTFMANYEAGSTQDARRRR